jgi:hypothetical protein
VSAYLGEGAARRHRRRVVLSTTLLVLVVMALAYLVGVGWLQCLLLATAVTTVCAIYRAAGGFSDDSGLPPLEASGRDAGTRREVSRLSWAMAGHDNRVGSVPFRRLRAIAVNRLSLRGIDVGTAAGQQQARELLGSDGYEVLIAETNATPTQRRFQDCLTLLEGLDPSSSRACC